MKSRLRILVLIPVLALLTVGSLFAAGEGRMIGTVVDSNGEPVAGVKVTVTSPQLSSFIETTETKKNGKFIVAFADAYLPYLYSFEKTGFQKREVEYKAARSGISREIFEIYEGQDPAAGGGEVASGSNEAILAFNAALSAFQAGDMTTAETKVTEALALDAEIYQAQLLLAELSHKQRNYERAATASEAALALAPGNSDALRLRYQAYRDGGDKTKAEEAFEDFKAAGEAGREAKRVYNEGVQLDRGGDSEAAYAKFLQAAEMDPSLDLANKAIMAAAFKTKRFDEAAKAAERILVINPVNPEALRVRYDSYVGLGDNEKVFEALVDLGAVDQEFVSSSLLQKAGEMYNSGDSANAAKMYKKVLEVNPNHAKSHYQLGIISVQSGDNAAAKAHFEKFLAMAPDDPDASTAKEMMAYL